MRRRGLLLSLVLALGMGLAAGALVVRQSARTTPVVTKKEKTVKVVVLSRELDRGVRLTKQDLKLQDWPERLATPQFVRTVKEAEGRVILNNAVPGEPLLKARLAPPGSTEGLATLIPEGRRGFSVQVNDVTGVSGFLLPGSRVDVLATVEVNVPVKQAGKDASAQKGRSSRKMTMTKTILQDVEVLAAGGVQKVGKKKSRVTTNAVTLLLTPEQSHKLALAATMGSIWLSLRGNRDKRLKDLKVISVDEMFLGGPPARKEESDKAGASLDAGKDKSGSKEPPKPPGYVVEIYSGGKKKKVEF